MGVCGGGFPGDQCNRALSTSVDAFSTTLAEFGLVDVDVTVAQKGDQTENRARARLHAPPAGLASRGVNPDVRGAVMSRQRQVQFHDGPLMERSFVKNMNV